ncbi:TonB family protein [Spirosoma sp. BT702]|uniref:TonB family protein n=1 Tax=Spirosoma profusum TaxID=2771354 RepID=A0A927GA38_9BACT|nr:energy transducer TonB [Spirosoma profusum]MBD2704904.1 TonB family protein [Spirosoma profusum]
MLPNDTSALSYDEIIFQARNRAYGAFELRRQYRPTLNRALGLGIGLFLLALSAPMLHAHFFPTDQRRITEVMLEHYVMKLPEQPIEPPVTLPPVEQPPAVNTVRNLPPVVMPEAEVVEENLPATTDQLEDATSGTETAEGTGDLEAITAPEASAPTVQEKVVEANPKPEETFILVEQQPEFPGGMDALRSFLSKNLNYPRAAASAGVSGRVYISFVVNTDGSLTDVHVLKGVGFGCDEEALRVVNKMPTWRPGKQSGRTVRVKYNLPITFTLE